MEKAFVVIYYCYGLIFDTVRESDLNEKIRDLEELEQGEAGRDARQLKYLCHVPKEDFISALIDMLE